MRIATIFVLLLAADHSHAGEFLVIDVNRGNQKERSKDYFAVETADGENGCVHFTVRVKANPQDKQVRSSLARLEVYEGAKRIAWVPVDRQAGPDDDGHVIRFELTPELVKKTKLVLVHLTVAAGGNVYRVDLASYAAAAKQP